jgi:hypothetical protein
VLDIAAWFTNLDLVAPALTVKTDGDIAEIEHRGEPHIVTSRQGAQRRYQGSGWTVTLRNVGRRTPASLTITLADADRSATVTARIPR